MRLLVLGAGALGGYYGGRLHEAGGDVAFLVRPARAEALRRDGLRIESPYGDAHLPVRAVTEAGPGFDAVLLTCKSYDLPGAIEAVRPAVEAGAPVVPVLNGMSHIAALQEAFGPERVLGGLAKIQATLTPEGTVRHFNDWRWLFFGRLDGAPCPVSAALEEAFVPAKGVVAKQVPDMERRLWEKIVHLGTSAIGTVLLRGDVGRIVRAGGTGLLHRVLQRNAAIAAHHGHPVTDAFMAEYGALFSDAGSAYVTSMLRDIERGARNEGEAVLGFLLEAARRAGVPDEIHEAALLHARVQQPG
ncbi:2-dehydropantoate 2-reductase [Sabulicella glaciei]|uniref:2-dehydropantoate 2-reductase n=1 Tax=Sabulicella glaciei TaxID=2984948 RepID=A0ABT3NYF1_9PROT|nr:2-dehydropantoate 2-reductase [Roseococcus sp. MDT2-1-1]MCW8087192.1 2-dehydropantoate 2-reductase [Roseococcus sp. MDT2-1-1]